MKPDWKDPPKWANWLAMDENGAWFWYEREPMAQESSWFAFGREERCFVFESWEHAKEKRQ